MVSFYEYGQINRNTCEASFDVVEYTGHSVVFSAHTNGSASMVNINIRVEQDTESTIIPQINSVATGQSRINRYIPG